MKNIEAIELVKQQISLKNDEEFVAVKVKDFDNYWYVSCSSNSSGQVTDGYTYAVNIESRIIYAVPSSMPAHFNLRSVVSGDAVEVSNLPKHSKKNNPAIL